MPYPGKLDLIIYVDPQILNIFKLPRNFVLTAPHGENCIPKLDMPEMKEILRLLRYNGNNINQIAKRLNADEGIYISDISDIKGKQAEILKLIRGIYLKLLKL